MPAIPIPRIAPTDQFSPEVGAPQSQATGADFGSDVGAATAGLGGAISQFGTALGDAFDKQQKQKDQLAVATAVAKNPFTQTYNNLVNNAAPDGSGLVKSVQDAGMKSIDDQVTALVQSGGSPAAARELRVRLLDQQAQHNQNAENQANKMANDNAKLGVDKGLTQQLDDIATGGAITLEDFTTRQNTANALVDAAPLEANQKTQLKQNWEQQAVASRFDAALSAAEKSSDPNAVQAVLDDIKKPFWNQKFDHNILENRIKVLTQTQAQVDKLKLGNEADVHLNAIRADPTQYQAQTKAALDTFNASTTLTGLEKTQEIARIKSNAAAVYFEGKSEKAQSPADIDALKQELNDPKNGFQNEMSATTFDAEQKSLIQKRNLLTQQQDSVSAKAAASLDAVVKHNEEVTTVLANHLLEKADKMPITDAEMNDLNDKASQLESQELNNKAKGFGIPPELGSKIQDIFYKREAFRNNHNQPASHTVKYLYENMTQAGSLLQQGNGDPADDAPGPAGPAAPAAKGAALSATEQTDYANYKKATQGSVGQGGITQPAADDLISKYETDHGIAPGGGSKIATGSVATAGATPTATGVIKPTGGSMQAALTRPWSSRRVGYIADNGVQVTANIIDKTNLQGMQPRAWTILQGGVAAAAPAGIARIEITAGQGPGHLSHMAGTAMDVVGYQDKAGTKLWTNAQKVAFLRGVAGAGGNRFGMYETANDVHIDYAHDGFPAAVWGAGGLTSGDASRNFRDPNFKNFADQYAAGSIATNRDSAIVPYSPNQVTGANVNDYMPRFMTTIGQMETGGQANPYGTIVNQAAGGKAALGRYGILLENVGPWSERVLGRTVSPSEFLGNSKIQDDIFKGIFGMYVRKYGPEGAARAWLGGEGSVAHPAATDSNGKSVGDYGAEFTRLMGGSSSYDSAPSASALEAGSRQQLIQMQTATAVQTQNQQQMSNGGFINFVADSMNVPSSILNTDAGYDQRAQDYEAGKQRFQPTQAQATPFSPDEASDRINTLKSGDAQKILNLAQAISRWPTDMQEDAYRQLGKEAPTEVMAARYAARGDATMALSQIRGDQALKMNPDPVWKKAFDAAWSTADGAGDLLRGNVDTGLANMKVGLKGSLASLYMDKYGPSHPYDQAEMDQLTEQATGRSIGVVNGLRTLMPQGTTPSEFEHFQEVADWQKISITQTQPMGQDPNTGQVHPITPYDMSRAQPMNVGANVYKFIIDGKFVKTIAPNNQVLDYQAAIDKPTIDEANRAPMADPTQAPAGGAGAGLGIVPSADQPSIMGVPQPGGGARTATTEDRGLPMVPGAGDAVAAAAAAAAAPTAVQGQQGSVQLPPPSPGEPASAFSPITAPATGQGGPPAAPAAPGAPPAPPAAPVAPAPGPVVPAPTPAAVLTPSVAERGKPTAAQQAEIDKRMAIIEESNKRQGLKLDPELINQLETMITASVMSGGGKTPKELSGRSPLRRGH